MGTNYSSCEMKTPVRPRRRYARSTPQRELSMERAHLDELIELENHYWWHITKRNIATDLLRKYVPPPARIIEGGIGAAGNLLNLKQSGYDVSRLDIIEDSVTHAKSIGIGEIYKHDLQQPWPVAQDSFGGVVLLDVLEHVADPVKVLKEAAKIIQGTGKIIFTIPAYLFLFSDWDERRGHYRRYTLAMIRDQFAATGLKTERLRYWNSFTFPATIFI
jgi:2-polyprenyl-3-methyl-5-hydroxy-6-metoxy-1,4-benzoquinol methylase